MGESSHASSVEESGNQHCGRGGSLLKQFLETTETELKKSLLQKELPKVSNLTLKRTNALLTNGIIPPVPSATTFDGAVKIQSITKTNPTTKKEILHSREASVTSNTIFLKHSQMEKIKSMSRTAAPTPIKTRINSSVEKNVPSTSLKLKKIRDPSDSFEAEPVPDFIKLPPGSFVPEMSSPRSPRKIMKNTDSMCPSSPRKSINIHASSLLAKRANFTDACLKVELGGKTPFRTRQSMEDESPGSPRSPESMRSPLSPARQTALQRAKSINIIDIKSKTSLNSINLNHSKASSSKPNLLPEEAESKSKSALDPGYYQVRVGNSFKIVQIVHPKKAISARPKKKQWTTNKKHHIEQATTLTNYFTQDRLNELYEDLRTNHADEAYMDNMAYTLENCYELARSISNNLRISAEMHAWKKLEFQGFIIAVLNKISNRLLIGRLFDFMAEKNTLQKSPKLTVQFILSNLICFMRPERATLEKLIEGHLESIGEQISAQDMKSFLEDFNVDLKNKNPGAFCEFKKLATELSTYVMRRRIKNLDTDGKKILDQVLQMKKKDEARKLAMDCNFENKQRMFATTGNAALFEETNAKPRSLLGLMEEAKQFHFYESTVPQGYVNLQETGREVLANLRNMFSSKYVDKPAVLLPLETNLNPDHPMIKHHFEKEIVRRKKREPVVVAPNKRELLFKSGNLSKQ